MVDYDKLIKFVNENDVRLTFREYGRKGEKQLCLGVYKSHTPLPGGEVGKALISAIMSVMTARGMQP